jgi:MFS family permease
MLSMSVFGGKDPPSGASCSTDRRPNESIVKTNIPARLDRLPWALFHTRVVVALGITWVLDGLEVTIAGAISGALKQSPSLHFSNADVGIASSAYLAGAVLGAIFFGWLTDRLEESACSSLHLRSILSPRQRRHSRGTSLVLSFSACSPGLVLVVNIRLSNRPFRN